jgi:hypothetical protein
MGDTAAKPIEMIGNMTDLEIKVKCASDVNIEIHD